MAHLSAKFSTYISKYNTDVTGVTLGASVFGYAPGNELVASPDYHGAFLTAAHGSMDSRRMIKFIVAHYYHSILLLNVQLIN